MWKKPKTVQAINACFKGEEVPTTEIEINGKPCAVALPAAPVLKNLREAAKASGFGGVRVITPGLEQSPPSGNNILIAPVGRGRDGVSRFGEIYSPRDLT